MMDSMGTLPGVVRDEHDGMNDVSDSILELLVLGEGTVSAFVCEDPEAHGDCTSDGRVTGPNGPGEGIGRVEDSEHGDADCCADSCAKDGDGEVTEGFGSVNFEAVLWNYATNFSSGGEVFISPGEGLSFEALLLFVCCMLLSDYPLEQTAVAYFGRIEQKDRSRKRKKGSTW